MRSFATAALPHFLKVSHTYVYENKGDNHDKACSICQDSATGETHTYVYDSTGVKTDKTHTVKCVCGATDTEIHTDKKDSNGYCDVCDYKLPTNYGSIEEPISVVDALKIAADECKNKNDATKQMVVAKGVVVRIGETGSYYKEVVIRDESDVNKTILVRTLNMTEGVDNPDVNDTITIEGYIKNYDGEIGFSTNNQKYVNMIANTRGESSVTVGDVGGATVSGITGGKVKNGEEVSFEVTPPDGKKVTEVKVNGTKIDAESDGKTYKFVVHGDAVITITTADEGAEPEPEEKVITFTFSEIKGTTDATSEFDKYTETVDGYTLNIPKGTKVYEGKDHTLKLGASKDAALLKFDVPENVKSVNIYVAQYNSTSVTVTVNKIAKTLSSGQGVYECISVDTTETHSITLTTSGSDYRARINKIEWVVSGSSGGGGTEQHKCQDACPTCGKCTTDCSDPACAEKCDCTGVKLLASITFGSTGDVIQSSTTEITYGVDGYSFINKKENSSSWRTNDKTEYRIYTNSTFQITGGSAFTKLVFTCTSEDYAKALKNTIGSDATASGVTVTVTFAEAITLTAIYTAGAQARVTSLEIWG